MPDVLVLMGSQSDWPVMEACCMQLAEFDIRYHSRIVSAHRTPDRLDRVVCGAEQLGCKVIIAGAGGAAALPGDVAARTTLPVIGVPIKSSALNGMDSLLSIVQMPPGVPVGCMAIDGAKNAALYAARILALHDSDVRRAYTLFVSQQTEAVAEIPVDNPPATKS